MSGRKIIHVDMDAFYASVEQRDNPKLKGKPLVVGGNADSRGVVASCSYEARKFGIRSAMSSRRAAGLCPSVVFVRPRMSRYVEVSRQIRAIFHSVTALVEPLSLDEAYLDVTENLLGEVSATRLAQRIRGQIESELKLTASAGVGPNKFIAKVASDYRKPNGLTVVPPSRALEFVEKLPVERFWGVGPATAKRLHERGLKTGLDIRNARPERMHHWFGKMGLFLYKLSLAEDDREVSADRERKSCGSETTFSDDIRDMKILSDMVKELCEDVAQSLDKLASEAYCVVLKVKYSDFTSVTRSRTLPNPVRSAASITETALELLKTATEAGSRPIRLLGVSVKLPSSGKQGREKDTAQLDLEL